MRRWVRDSARLVGALWLGAAVGCSGGGSPETDGGADAAIDGGEAFVTPEAPAPPSFGPCPEGWAEATSETGIATCEPWPEGPQECEGAQAQLPGEPGCRRIGRACPTGDFPEDLPSDRPLRFVLAGASGGDGSREQPFGSIADALDGISSGTVVVIGPGTYDEAVRLPSGITLQGACPDETTLRSSSPTTTAGVVTTITSGGAVRDLRIGPSARAGLWVRGESASLDVEGVVIEGTQVTGVEVWEGAELTARDLVVRDTQPRPSDRDFGRGINVEVGAHAEVVGGVFERNHDSGLFVQMDGSALFEDVVVRDTLPQASDGSFGRGLYALSRSSVQVRRSVFERNRDFGVMSEGLVTSVELEHVVIRDTRPRQDDDDFGRAVQAQHGGAVTARKLLAEGNRQFCVAALDPDSTLALEDTVIRDCRPGGVVPGQGRGLTVQDGAMASVVRLVVEDGHEAGIAVSGAMLDFSDVLVRDIAPQQSDGYFGRGLTVQSGGEVDGRRLRVERSHEVGVFANQPGTTLRLEDLVVSDTRGHPELGTGGRGIEVDRGASVEVVRGRVSRSRGVGVFAAIGSSVRLEGVGVEQTLPLACGESTCSDRAGGVGMLSVLEDARIEATDFEVSGASLCGVLVAPGGDMALSEGHVVRNPIGACVQNEAFAVDRLSTGVEFRDNDINLDTTSLPVPEPFEGL